MTKRQNFTVRNVLKNLTNRTLNKAFPGIGRSSTTRDIAGMGINADHSHIINETTVSLISGVAVSGE